MVKRGHFIYSEWQLMYLVGIKCRVVEDIGGEHERDKFIHKRQLVSVDVNVRLLGN